MVVLSTTTDGSASHLRGRTTHMTTRIDKVTVLGTGVLGSQIAYQTAYSGFEVTAYDISDEIVEKAKHGFADLAARYEKEVDGASDGPAQAALARITYSSRLQQLDTAAQRAGRRDGPVRPVPRAPLRQRDLGPQRR
jgi:D-arabinose 1-dehydrogenase-like Zn-dependent alcohol dehydrogenase